MHRSSFAEDGSAIILVLLVAVTLLGVGVVAMWAASTTSRLSGNINRRIEAMQAAEAGIQRARAIVNEGTYTWTQLLQGQPCGSTEVAGKGYELCFGSDAAEKNA